MRDLSENFGVPSRTSDPSSPTDGDMWYRSDEDRFRARVNSVVVPLNFMAVTHVDPVAGAWYEPAAAAGATATEITATLNSVFTHPLMVGRKVTLTGITLHVAVAGASSNVGRMALYSGSIPTTLITDYGTVSTTSTGVKTWSPSTVLTPGVQYWVAFACQVGTAAQINTMTYAMNGTFYNVASGSPTAGNFTGSPSCPFPTWTASGAFAGSPTVTVASSSSGRKLRMLFKFD